MTSDYSWSRNANRSWTITDLRAGSPDGVDTLSNLEFLHFSDSSVAIVLHLAGAPVVINTARSFTSSARSARFTAYYRDKQGKSGLGIEAQREAVRQRLNRGSWQLVGGSPRSRLASEHSGRSSRLHWPSLKIESQASSTPSSTA